MFYWSSVGAASPCPVTHSWQIGPTTDPRCFKVHWQGLKTQSTIPGVSTILVRGVQHALKRLPKPVEMLHALIPLHPSLKITTKMRNNVKSWWETKQKRQLAHPGRQKCLLSINWLRSWKSMSHHESLDAFVEHYILRNKGLRGNLWMLLNGDVFCPRGKNCPALSSLGKSPATHPSSPDAFQACQWLLFPTCCKKKWGMSIASSALMGREIWATSGTENKTSNWAFNVHLCMLQTSPHTMKYCPRCPRNLGVMALQGRHVSDLFQPHLDPTRTFLVLDNMIENPINQKVQDRRKPALQVGATGQINFHLHLPLFLRLYDSPFKMCLEHLDAQGLLNQWNPESKS